MNMTPNPSDDRETLAEIIYRCREWAQYRDLAPLLADEISDRLDVKPKGEAPMVTDASVRRAVATYMDRRSRGYSEYAAMEDVLRAALSEAAASPEAATLISITAGYECRCLHCGITFHDANKRAFACAACRGRHAGFAAGKPTSDAKGEAR